MPTFFRIADRGGRITSLGTFFLLWSMVLPAQISVMGRVLSAEQREPLGGATISTRTAGVIGLTDEQGFFSLQTESDTLLFSYLGRESRQVALLRDESFWEILLPRGTTGLPLFTATSRPPTGRYLRVPASISQVGPAALNREDGLSPAPILNRVPGVFFQTGTYGTNRITIRGVGSRAPFGTTKIRAYLNDIPLTNGVGETTIEDLDLSLFSGIQIWRGPSASSLGAGLGGAIQLQTPTSNPQDSNHLAWQNTLQTGSFGQWRALSQLTQTAPGLRLSLQLQRVHSDGFRQNNEYDRAGVSLLGQFNPHPRHSLAGFLQVLEVKAGIPSSINANDFARNPRVGAANWAAVQGFEDYTKTLVGINHRYLLATWGAGHQVHSSLSVFSTTNRNYESRPFNILRENSHALGLRAVATYRQGAVRQLPNLAIGMEGFTEQYAWQTNATRQGILDTLLSDQMERRQYVNLFAESHLDWGPRWFSTLGVNLNLTHYRRQDFFGTAGRSGERDFTPVWSPRVSLGYRLHPLVSIFSTWGHGFAAPTLEETLTPTGAINPSIQPEKGWNWELGLRGKLDEERWSWECSWYYLMVRDLLVARRTMDDQFIGINAGKASNQGLEAASEYQFNLGSAQIIAYAAYTWSHFRFLDFTDRDRDFSGKALPGVPPHHGSAGVEMQYPWGLYAHCGWEWTDRLPIDDSNTIYADAYQLVNIRLGWNGRQGQWSWRLYGGIQNLLDARYAGMVQVNAPPAGPNPPRYYYPGLPRNGYLGVQIGWQR